MGDATLKARYKTYHSAIVRILLEHCLGDHSMKETFLFDLRSVNDLIVAGFIAIYYAQYIQPICFAR